MEEIVGRKYLRRSLQDRNRFHQWRQSQNMLEGDLDIGELRLTLLNINLRILLECRK